MIVKVKNQCAWLVPRQLVLNHQPNLILGLVTHFMTKCSEEEVEIQPH